MNIDILLTYAVLLIAIILFSTEKLRTDIVAILIMVVLPWLNIITVEDSFSGFSSNAVIAVMAVMLMGYGIDRSGVMVSFSEKVMAIAGDNSRQITAISSLSVGIISSFLQNIGATALFLPAVKNLARKSGISLSRIIMPIGFSAILGGTITMVASGPLIVLNDLLKDSGYQSYNLFSVTPIGIGLLIGGVLYFYLLADKVLPEKKGKENKTSSLDKVYDLPNQIYEVTVDSDCKSIGESIEGLDIWENYKLHILAISEGASISYIPWRKTRLQKGQTLAILGKRENLDRFMEREGLSAKKDLEVFKNLKDEDYAGFAEIIIPPRSNMSGKTLKEIALRKNFTIEPIIYIDRNGERLDEIEQRLESGMEMIVFGRWEDIEKLKSIRDFVVITKINAPKKNDVRSKKKKALFSLSLSVLLVILGFPLPHSFLTGALIMILLGVIPKEEIYEAIDWKTVFLLAGLIPLGIAFEKSGAAKMTADIIIGVAGDWPILAILYIVGVLAALFSIFMSNVAATVLLVPLIILMGESFGIDPRGLAMLVAVSASNSFILPTHQVNAFTMGAGGYRNRDYLRAGSIMTVIFLNISVLMVYVFYI